MHSSGEAELNIHYQAAGTRTSTSGATVYFISTSLHPPPILGAWALAPGMPTVPHSPLQPNSRCQPTSLRLTLCRQHRYAYNTDTREFIPVSPEPRPPSVLLPREDPLQVDVIGDIDVGVAAGETESSRRRGRKIIRPDTDRECMRVSVMVAPQQSSQVQPHNT